jgi:predicted protein tyrosine phosphatase
LVQYTSRKLAEQLRGTPYMAVISITDPTTPEAKLDPLFRHVLRLSFFDAVPADEYLPAPMPGLFDHHMAALIDAFISELHAAPFEMSLMVHCEFGVSRSAAVALYAAALTEAPLEAREFTYEANQWVLDRLSQIRPELNIDLPPVTAVHDRRERKRPL